LLIEGAPIRRSGTTGARRDRQRHEDRHMITQASDRAILTQINPHAANLLSMAVREPIRRGESGPAAIRATAEARPLAWEGCDDRRRDATRAAAARAALDAMTGHPDELAAFVRHCIANESLPAEERRQLKVERNEPYRREWMGQQPPTEQQVRYCRMLGYQGAIESKAHAADIIDRLRAGRLV
jgi:hypothetical protein